MPTLKFQKNRTSIEVEKGTNLMRGLLEHGVPVASSCKGDAVCGKCWVKVLEGGDNLSAPTPDELHLLKANQHPVGVRVSCQANVLGDVTLDATYW